MTSGEWFDLNVQRAGELFLKAQWIQGQMADLLIFAERPDLIEPFHAIPEVMPTEFVELRVEAWEKDFTPTRDAFVARFTAQLSEDDLADLAYLNSLRNAIGHCHLSLGRDYFLYRPRSNREQQAVQGLALAPREGSADPTVIKLAFFDDDYYLASFNRIERLDEGCLKRVATGLGLSHGRIR